MEFIITEAPLAFVNDTGSDLHYRIFLGIDGEISLPASSRSATTTKTSAGSSTRRPTRPRKTPRPPSAVRQMRTARVADPSTEAQARQASVLTKAGMGLTRAQAIDAALARSLD